MPIPQQLIQLIRHQSGVVHRRQARSAGLSDDQVDRLLASGSWTRLLPSIFLVDTASLTWRAWAFAAILAAGQDAAIIGRSAASLRGWVPLTLPICLAVPAERRVRLHTNTISVYRLDVPETDRVVIDGLPTTTRLRTAVDVAHLMPIVQAQPILDRLLVLDTVQLGELTTVIEASRRSGSAQARALMRSAADLAAAESERHARRVLREAGVTGWTPNHSVTVRGGRTIKVDLALKRLRIAIEVKGWIFHSKSDRAKGDDDRVTDLQLAGWFVIPVGWLELMSDPEGFVAKVLAAVAARTPHAA